MSRPARRDVYKQCDCRRPNDCPHAWHWRFMHTANHTRTRYRFALAQFPGAPEPMSRDQAEDIADAQVKLIRKGLFIDPRMPKVEAPLPTPTDAKRTLADVVTLYTKAKIQTKAKRSEERKRAMIKELEHVCRTEIPGAHGQRIRLGDKHISAITAGDLMYFRIERQEQAARLLAEAKADAEARAKAKTAAEAQGQPATASAPPVAKRPTRPVVGCRGNAVGTNRLLQALRPVLRFAHRLGDIASTPFEIHGKPDHEVGPNPDDENGRKRLLQPGEEDALLAHAGPHLKALIVGALDLGGRRGELLNLLWRDVRSVEGPDKKSHPVEVKLIATKTKDTERLIPVTDRLRGYLEYMRVGPDGKDLGDDCYVFGNEVGEKVANVKRAWATAVLKSHGYTPKYTAKGQLDEDSRAAYAAIDLKFHDLRHESGSVLLASGATLVEVRDYLGHSDISTTNKYLQVKGGALAAALAKRDQYRQDCRTIAVQTTDQAPEASTAGSTVQ